MPDFQAEAEGAGLPGGPTPVPIPRPIPIPLPPVGIPVALTENVPFNSTTPAVAVTVPNQSGTVTLSLIVTDNFGVKSPAATANVTIQAPPVAILTATPANISPGGVIELSGIGSTTTGSISNYQFTLLPPIA